MKSITRIKLISTLCILNSCDTMQTSQWRAQESKVKAYAVVKEMTAISTKNNLVKIPVTKDYTYTIAAFKEPQVTSSSIILSIRNYSDYIYIDLDSGFGVKRQKHEIVSKQIEECLNKNFSKSFIKSNEKIIP